MENRNDNEGEIIVRLDPLIQKIVPEFLQHRRENAGLIWDALENSDVEKVANIAHDIEGTAGAFGFSEIAELAQFRAQPDNTFKLLFNAIHLAGMAR